MMERLMKRIIVHRTIAVLAAAKTSPTGPFNETTGMGFAAFADHPTGGFSRARQWFRRIK